MAIASAVNDKWEVRIIGKIEGQETENIFHFNCKGATSDVELHLIQVLLSCFITHMLPVLTSTWSLERVVWKQVGPVLGVEQISIPTGTNTGAGAAAALPSYCSALFSKRSLLGGKSRRGRMFFAGVPEDQTTGSFINAEGPFWAALLAFALCVITNFVHPDPAGGTDLFQFCIYSRKLGGSTLPYGDAGFTEVREFVPVRELSTTRSRKVGRGS